MIKLNDEQLFLLVVSMNYINEAYERMLKNDVKYRIVIDIVASHSCAVGSLCNRNLYNPVLPFSTVYVKYGWN